MADSLLTIAMGKNKGDGSTVEKTVESKKNKKALYLDFISVRGYSFCGLTVHQKIKRHRPLMIKNPLKKRVFCYT